MLTFSLKNIQNVHKSLVLKIIIWRMKQFKKSEDLK